MYKNLSRSKEIISRLKSEGKVKDLSNDPEFLKKVSEMNKYMEEVRRDYIVKAALSERSAAKVILNA